MCLCGFLRPLYYIQHIGRREYKTWRSRRRASNLPETIPSLTHRPNINQKKKIRERSPPALPAPPKIRTQILFRKGPAGRAHIYYVGAFRARLLYQQRSQQHGQIEEQQKGKGPRDEGIIQLVLGGDLHSIHFEALPTDPHYARRIFFFFFFIFREKERFSTRAFILSLGRQSRGKRSRESKERRLESVKSMVTEGREPGVGWVDAAIPCMPLGDGPIEGGGRDSRDLLAWFFILLIGPAKNKKVSSKLNYSIWYTKWFGAGVETALAHFKRDLFLTPRSHVVTCLHALAPRPSLWHGKNKYLYGLNSRICF